MSNQVGDCFKFLWPFQNVRTLALANSITHAILCKFASFIINSSVSATMVDHSLTSLDIKEIRLGI